MNEEFYTLKGYTLKNNNLITSAEEDYLEMICRLSETEQYVRVNHLSLKLNVSPSSTSKMVTQLKKHGLVEFEKYGIIRPTEKGWEMGKYLLHRHKVLNSFFSFINKSEDELEQVEQIEHFINKETIDNIEKLLKELKKNN